MVMSGRFHVGSEPSVWRAAGQLALIWQDAPRLREFAAHLPRNAANPRVGLADLLQWVLAGAGGMMSNPFRMSTMIPLAARTLPEDRRRQLFSDFQPWWESAQRVEVAAQETLSWMRSRLPGFPNIYVPQLAPETPLTTLEISSRQPWLPGLRSRQLQEQDVPQIIGQSLGTVGRVDRDLRQATRDLASALEMSQSWVAFQAAKRELTTEDRSQITAATRRLRVRLSPEALDEYEDIRALPRAAYREHVVAEEVASLPERARAYAKAFEDADALVEDAAHVILSQLCCYGVQRISAGGLEADPVSSEIRLQVQGEPSVPPSIGGLYWVDGVPGADAMFTTEVNFTFDASDGESIFFKGRVLNGSGDGWNGLDFSA